MQDAPAPPDLSLFADGSETAPNPTPAPVAEPTPAAPAPAPTPPASGNGIFSIMAGREAPKPVFNTGAAAPPQAPAPPYSPATPAKAPASPAATPAAAAPPQTGENLRDAAETAAEAWTATLGLFIPSICVALSGGDPEDEEKYTLTPAKEKRYKKICVPFFMEQGGIMSAKNQFLLGTLGIFGGMMIMAYKEGQKKEKSSAAVARIRKANKSTPKHAKQINELLATPPAVDREANQEFEAAVEQAGKLRNNFSIDNRGYFTHSEKGTYLKKRERNQRPTGKEKELCKYFYQRVTRPKNGQDEMTWTDANEEIRLSLYGQREAIRAPR